MNRSMKRLNRLIRSGMLLALLLTTDHAYATACRPLNNSPNLYDYRFNSSLVNNQIGDETPWIEMNKGGTYNVEPPCDTNPSETYFTLQPANDLTAAGSSNAANWYDIPENNYMQVAMQVYIGGVTDQYFNIPNSAVSNKCRYGVCTPGAMSSGGKVKIKLRIKKKFIGVHNMALRNVGLIYAATRPTDTAEFPVAKINLATSISVPASCSFDVGDVIEFDFGPISSNAFVGVAAGNRVEGVNPVIKSLGIKCNGLDVEQTVSARLESGKASNKAIVSNNPDVGFEVADKDDRILRPNDLSSVFLFNLDQNAQSRFILKSWPVSLTGIKPQAGPVNAEGHIRIDYQ